MTLPPACRAPTVFCRPVAELAGGNVNTFQPTLNSVIIGVPPQEKGIRPARALPYELDVHASVNASNSTVGLTFFNTGSATVVFQVRSGNPADPVRNYTVEPGKTLAGTWNVASSYNLSVYGPNGFVRYFNGSIGSSAAVLDVRSSYGSEGDRGSIQWKITNVAANDAEVSVLDAYTGNLTHAASPAPRDVCRRVVAGSVPWLVRPHRHGCRRPDFQIPACGSRRNRRGQLLGSGSRGPCYPQGLIRSGWRVR